MKSNIFTIVKKELSRVFGDKRMLISILMPGVLIYVMYTFMGDALMNNFSTEEDYRYQVAAVEMPDSVSGMISDQVFDLSEPDDLDEALTRLENQELDLVAVFPENFDEAVADYDPSLHSVPAPNVELYFNSASTTSGQAYSMMVSLLDSYESDLANKFDINKSDKIYDKANEKDTTGMIFSMMMPMLLLTFMFSGCLAVAPESIAGEKERGTIATLLVTPMKRSELAIGKILSLSLVAILSGVSSFVGTMLALPKLMGGSLEGINAGVYSITDYLMLFVIIITTILVIVSVISIISAFANSVKEATGYVSPLMLVVVLIGVTAMFGGGAKPLYWYLVPLYNSVQCISGIFSFDYSYLNVAVTAAANILLAGVLAFVLTRMFNSEKIMFRR